MKGCLLPARSRVCSIAAGWKFDDWRGPHGDRPFVPSPHQPRIDGMLLPSFVPTFQLLEVAASSSWTAGKSDPLGSPGSYLPSPCSAAQQRAAPSAPGCSSWCPLSVLLPQFCYPPPAEHRIIFSRPRPRYDPFVCERASGSLRWNNCFQALIPVGLTALLPPPLL